MRRRQKSQTIDKALTTACNRIIAFAKDPGHKGGPWYGWRPLSDSDDDRFCVSRMAFHLTRMAEVGSASLITIAAV